MYQRPLATSGAREALTVLGNDTHGRHSSPPRVSFLVDWSRVGDDAHRGHAGSPGVSLVVDWSGSRVGDDAHRGHAGSPWVSLVVDWGSLLNHCSGLGLGWFGWVG
jgi:hypothetical protein